MTGFGRASFLVAGVAHEVEARSVNHRYLDAKVRLPRLLAAFEAEVRARIQARFARGKVDLGVTAAAAVPSLRLEIDLAVARDYLRAARALAADGVPGEIEAGTLLALPGVSRFAEPAVSSEALREALLRATDDALDGLDAMRRSEGAALERDLLARATEVDHCAQRLAARAGEVQAAVRERLRRRAEQLRQETGIEGDGRLHQELVLAADRLDVTEELVRLRSHVEQLRRIVAEGDSGKPVGRRLDFLLQEFAREANTIGSKGSDAPIAHEIVELKAEIERMREQVQNVE
jgi:uncharacterized protein (TIGR00255 family)